MAEQFNKYTKVERGSKDYIPETALIIVGGIVAIVSLLLLFFG